MQRQIITSRSASPWMRLQHGVFGKEPTIAPINAPSKFTHTPNFRASLGQVALLRLGLGFGFGFGVGLEQMPHALTR